MAMTSWVTHGIRLLAFVYTAIASEATHPALGRRVHGNDLLGYHGIRLWAFVYTAMASEANRPALGCRMHGNDPLGYPWV